MINVSPIRYPGGKAQIASKIAAIINASSVRDCIYVEPFAGGAGVALSLLLSGKVKEIVINDVDKAVSSFWKAIIEKPEQFIDKIRKTPITIDEWRRQKDIYAHKNGKYSFDLGFAFFFLNRTNRSGILKGGPIGGFEQKGNWKIDCRFNRENLISRINAIVAKKSQIHVYSQDVFDFFKHFFTKYQRNAFVYFDPPYYNKAGKLYQNSFTEDQHVQLCQMIVNDVQSPWIVSYDDVPEIRNIYNGVASELLNVTYSAARKEKGSERMFFCPELNRVYLQKKLVQEI